MRTNRNQKLGINADIRCEGWLRYCKSISICFEVLFNIEQIRQNSELYKIFGLHFLLNFGKMTVSALTSKPNLKLHSPPTSTSFALMKSDSIHQSTHTWLDSYSSLCKPKHRS